MNHVAIRNMGANCLKKTVPVWAVALSCLATTAPANAYILKKALAGKVTIEVTGACAIPTTTVNAYLADIYTDANALIGHGIVTTSGILVALEDSRSELEYKHVLATGIESAVYRVDTSGNTLHTFLTANGLGCDIEALQPTLGSLARYQWSDTGGKVNYDTKFGGHVKKVCYSSATKEYCVAEQFRGTVFFKGAWSAI